MRHPKRAVDTPGPGPAALAHDYLTQRGGAERVVLSMLRAFPSAPLYTSLYHPEGTFPQFGAADVRVSRLNLVPALRRDHRLALPFLAPTWSRLSVDAPVIVCSSTGWAHGARASGRKIVYCHNPARWLYQRDQYLGHHAGIVSRTAISALAAPLHGWDRRSARSADRYLVNSTVVRDRVWQAYGIEAEVLHPPPAYTAGHARDPVAVEPGYWLMVTRLLPYKNIDRAIAAFSELPGERLVVVGRGPDRERLAAMAGPNVALLGGVGDDQLAWLYANSAGLIAAAYEDFGLAPVESNVFGRPVVALRWGGHLDTVIDGLNGVYFDEPEPAAIATAVRRAARDTWSAREIEAQAANFAEASFVARLREVVAEEAAAG